MNKNKNNFQLLNYSYLKPENLKSIIVTSHSIIYIWMTEWLKLFQELKLIHFSDFNDFDILIFSNKEI